MKRIGILLCLLMVVMGLSISAQGALVDMQDGTIYDTDTQLSWLKDGDATGIRALSWYDAMAWTESLNADGGFAGLTGWRLPHADPACGRNYNCFNSEMGHLYYIELGNVAWGSPINTGPFTNMEPLGFYWTDTEYAPQPSSAWGFGFYNGGQDIDDKTAVSVNAWAVRHGARSGDVTYTITASAEANGSIFPTGAVPVLPNTNQSFTITPNVNYRIADVLVDGSSVGAITSYTFNNVMANHTISASFAIDQEPVAGPPYSYPIAVCIDACSPNVLPRALTTDLYPPPPYSNVFAWTTLTEQATSSAYLNEMICTGTPFQDVCNQQIFTTQGTITTPFRNFESVMFDPAYDAANKEIDFMGNVIAWNIIVPVTGNCPPGGQGTIEPQNTWGNAYMRLIAACGIGIGCRGYDAPPGICYPSGPYPKYSIVIDQISCFSCAGIPQLMILPPNVPGYPIFFGPINVGDTSTAQEIRIGNMGSNILHISEVNIEGSDASDFAIKSNNCTVRVLPPSSECTIELVFSPTSGGDKNATLAITSNDPDNPVTEVHLNGWGVVSAYNLSVTNITGSGTVSAIGIACASDCSESYDSGTNVELTAIPDTGWYFDFWGGDISGSANPYALIMDSDKNITATFKEIDTDGDGVPDSRDNCPLAQNPDQSDIDNDGKGDVCDICPYDAENDGDLDGICGDVDNCPGVSNPSQLDSDSDGTGDACDACPSDVDNDTDGDGVCGNVDNCPQIANPVETIFIENFEDTSGFTIGGGSAAFWGIAPLSGTPAIPSYFVQGGSQSGNIFYGSFAKDFSDLTASPTMTVIIPDLTNYPNPKLTVALAAPYNPSGTMWEITHRDKLEISGDSEIIDLFRPVSGASPLRSQGYLTDLGYVFQDYEYAINNSLKSLTFTFASTDYDETIGIDSVTITVQLDSDGDGLGDICDTCPLDANNDIDADGVCGNVDNCPNMTNPDQTDTDHDGIGDVCDSCPYDSQNDIDLDGICGNEDNCPQIANSNQLDSDGDGKGDACDQCPLDPLNDSDGDGICGNLDNCPYVSNASQSDSDGDGIGDTCDNCPLDTENDADGDGVCGNVDNCPRIANAEQSDADNDGIGDLCDTCPLDANNDADADGVCGNVDNCPNMSNPDQTDTDQDGIGDACDSCPYDSQNDIDLDGICGNVDNCPQISNPNQENADGDSLGNACDACPNDAENDVDADGVCGDIDNCPLIPTANQDDEDGDSIGDECDSCPDDANNDIDGDTICGDTDNCPDVANTDQVDTDGDGKGDACDTCPLDANNDADGDGVCGNLDNCPNIANPDQTDVDQDGIGNACDTCPLDADNDADGDGVCGNIDNCPLIPNPTQADTDSDGKGDACDTCPLDANNDADGDGVCGNVDNCPNVANPNQADMDKDGIGDACDNDADGDGFVKGIDCNDLNPLINPFACDIRNDGIDQDCDGKDRTKGQPCVGEADGDLKELACNDRIDNDKDGLIDCADPDCARKKECR